MGRPRVTDGNDMQSEGRGSMGDGGVFSRELHFGNPVLDLTGGVMFTILLASSLPTIGTLISEQSVVFA